MYFTSCLLGELVHRREERMILRRVDVRHAGLEERELQVAHLLPVDHLGVQVEPELVDQLLDVVDGICEFQPASTWNTSGRSPSCSLAM